MDSIDRLPRSAAALLERLRPVLSRAAAEAERDDATGTFPATALDGLRAAGALAAPLRPESAHPETAHPQSVHPQPAHSEMSWPEPAGLGLGTTAPGTDGIATLLRALGRASLALGRVYEGHVNALRLIDRYATPAQRDAAARDARDGHLFAIWAAEAPTTRVVLDRGRLTGRKAFASGVGVVTRPLITMHVPGAGECLALVPLAPGQGHVGPPFDLHGMRAAATAAVDFTGIALSPDERIGAPEDYMRQPEISLGAWRALAVMLGGLDALVAAFATDLHARGRAGDPHQRARLGQALIAQETAARWTLRSAALAETDAPDEDAANYVKLARVAFEQACSDAITHARRALGIGAFVRPHPVERLGRDLATYLRQPAMDMVLDEAAAHFLTRPLP
ncbi:MAG: acyl-CoA dehydrogenase [Proteobacteria bacterium]|nr:acyl-CoA dehydrogenase [Pseudomonadota bacterium]